MRQNVLPNSYAVCRVDSNFPIDIFRVIADITVVVVDSLAWISQGQSQIICLIPLSDIPDAESHNQRIVIKGDAGEVFVDIISVGVRSREGVVGACNSRCLCASITCKSHASIGQFVGNDCILALGSAGSG